MIFAFGALLLLFAGSFAWWRFFFFHRNPSRTIPPGSSPVFPADGRILYVENVSLTSSSTNAYHRRVQEAFDCTGEWTVLATYLSIFDVHFVRSPIAGKVRLHHVNAINENQSMGGSFFIAALRRPLPIGRRSYTEKNEFLGVSVESATTQILLVLMADWWIDQILTFVDDGQLIDRGQVIGKIQMGSQVDLWIPADTFDSMPEVGTAVRAGETLLQEQSVNDKLTTSA